MGKNVIISTVPNVTQNYLSKLSTGNIFVDSLVYDNGTSVMINTATAHADYASARLIVNNTGNAYLEVRGNGGQGSIVLTTSTSTTGTYPTVEIFNSGNFGIVGYRPGVVSSNYLMYYDLGSSTNRALTFQTEGVTRLGIQGAGRILMGPTLPTDDGSTALQVNGGGKFSSSVTASGNLNLQGAVTRNINFYDSSNTNINAQIQYDQISSNSGQLFFGTNNAGTFATRLTISNTGAATFSSSISATSATFSGIVEVGNTVGSAINSASGLGNLVVGNGGASSQGITIYTGASTYGGLNFADATTGGGAYAGYIKFDHSDNSMGFFIGNVSRLSLASTGAATFSSTLTAGQSLFQVSDTGVGTKTIVQTLERAGASPSGTTRELGLVFKDGSNSTLVGGIAGVRFNSAGNYFGGLRFYVQSSSGTPATSFSDLYAALVFDYTGAASFSQGVEASSFSTNGTLVANGSFQWRKTTLSNISAGSSQTFTIISAPGATAYRSLQVVVTGLEAANAAIFQLKFDVIGRWSGASIVNSGIGNIDAKFSRGINDFVGFGTLTPTIGTSGNAITCTLSNSSANTMSNIVVNITENYS